MLIQLRYYWDVRFGHVQYNELVIYEKYPGSNFMFSICTHLLLEVQTLTLYPGTTSTIGRLLSAAVRRQYTVCVSVISAGDYRFRQ